MMNLIYDIRNDKWVDRDSERGREINESQVKRANEFKDLVTQAKKALGWKDLADKDLNVLKAKIAELREAS